MVLEHKTLELQTPVLICKTNNQTKKRPYDIMHWLRIDWNNWQNLKFFISAYYILNVKVKNLDYSI